MIKRVVLIKLAPKFGGDKELVAQHTREVLAQAPGVHDLQVGTPADARTRREWDLCITLRFESLDAVETYREHKVHRAYVDDYLRPMLDRIRALNFELPAETAE